jgi:hypothetical protein
VFSGFISYSVLMSDSFPTLSLVLTDPREVSRSAGYLALLAAIAQDRTIRTSPRPNLRIVE